MWCTNLLKRSLTTLPTSSSSSSSTRHGSTLVLSQTRHFHFSRSLLNQNHPRTVVDEPKKYFSWKHPLMYPLVLVFLFGSQVINIINIRKDKKEMQSLYVAKVEVLNQCIDRLGNGEKVSIEKELQKIEKKFKNRKALKERDYKALEELNTESADTSLNGSLDQLFKESLGEETRVVKPLEAAEELNNKQEHVKENVEKIVIRDVPGAMSDAASQRKVPKFL
ncbi:hypothetical protein DASC09_060460 [Saccharomycopsis crataegensis]|uniref:Uncharacterized protein n=1 Tax=Saccharomycopsis crataegensis TaxID=43959 RepID=A0AAV5QW93_9ASCO|nr:hypothetical protein DASC09_060460 [Saccharomycopsis crataegensis]